MGSELPEGFTLEEPTTTESGYGSELPEGFTIGETLETIPEQPTEPAVYKEGVVDYKPNPKQEAAFNELKKRGYDLPSLTDPSRYISSVKEYRELKDIESGKMPVKDEPAINLAGIPEVAATIGSGIIAEPIAGLGGIAGTILPGEEGQGAEWVGKIREAMTYKPKSEAAKETLTEIGEVVEPVAELMQTVETGLGDTVYEMTGSPTLAAAATTIPTIISEVVGAGFGKAGISGTRGTIKNIKKLRSEGQITKAIKSSVPEIDQLKDTARGLYKEIDETGATVKSQYYDRLTKELQRETKKAGIDKDITPKANKALKRFEELEGQDVTITDIDTLRKVAQNAASSMEPAEKALGTLIIKKVDDFIEKSDTKMFEALSEEDLSGISKKYKMARDLWGRARKSEVIQEAFTDARDQASGFENGLRIQFRSLLKNKKKRKFFNEDEIKSMEKVVRGDKVENLARLIGKFGFSEGSATSMLGGSIGVGAGAYAGGPVGAVMVPLIGQVSKKLAQRMTKGNAEFADQVIRSGKDARKITQSYIKNTDPKFRDPSELSELLMQNDIDLTTLPDTGIIGDAKNMAKENRALIIGSTAATEFLKTFEGEE